MWFAEIRSVDSVPAARRSWRVQHWSVPAGLDGNPNPTVTLKRSAVIETVADVVMSAKSAKSLERPLLVAVDGIDGAGKSTFADELAGAVRARGGVVIRSTIDSFHHERAVRYARGAAAPLGFYLDSHDLAALRRELLDPFEQGAGSRYRTACFDEPSDTELDAPVATVCVDDMLIFDGIFVQRPELADTWDLVVYLDAQERVDLERLGLVLDGVPREPVEAVSHTLEWVARIDRYASGMRYYLDLVDPLASADVVIDNNAIAAPIIVRRP